MRFLKYILFIVLNCFVLNTYALSDEYTFNGSKIGGLGYGTAENNLRIEPNTYNTISMNLLLNYYHYYGEVQSPIKSNDTTNIVFVSCIHKDAIIDGVFSSKSNYLDLSFVSNEKCTFNWETSPSDGRVQYTFARLKYSSSAFDQIDNESGTIYNWYYRFNTQSFGIQGLSFASSLYFTDIRFYTSSEYNNLLTQYRSLEGQNKIDNSINNVNGSINDLNGTINNDNVDDPSSSINLFKDKIATNGVITQLVGLPVTLFTKVLNSVNGTCSSYNLGSLFGTDLVLPCINVSNYLGSSLWGVIDVLISGLFVYTISKKFIKVFENMSSMNEGDVIGD